jgi:LPXTG-motif cell wall-anchored protein
MLIAANVEIFDVLIAGIALLLLVVYFGRKRKRA